MNNPGSFIISLDFELHWGVFDHTPLNERSRAYFDRTRALIPRTLELFERHGIQATWATVGMLFARSKAELEQFLPSVRPAYTNTRLDPYRLLAEVGEDEAADPYHFAPSLIEQIANTPGQAIGSHTFGHVYCLEEGQTAGSFGADLAAAQRLADHHGYPRSTALVFPRNQYREDFFPAVAEQGFVTYRGNPEKWFWKTRSGRDTTLPQRAVRLTDNYLPFAGDSHFENTPKATDGLVNVPSSRFFRPYVAKIDGFGGQQLKVRRILKEMAAAARLGRCYHLWWHPHNLATHPEKNMAALSEILQQFTALNDRYGWESHSMESYAQRLNTEQQ